MHWAVKTLLIVVAGAILGVLVTAAAVRQLPASITNGPWTTSVAIGSPQSDPYTRAAEALHGLFALKRDETIYFTATTDDAGNNLDGRCSYEIRGEDPDARWWSITVYGTDDFLIPNPEHRYSVAKTTVARNANGSFDIRIGGSDRSPNWIPAGSGRFSLTLRLYNPGAVMTTLDPQVVALPTLKRVSCP